MMHLIEYNVSKEISQILITRIELSMYRILAMKFIQKAEVLLHCDYSRQHIKC